MQEKAAALEQATANQSPAEMVALIQGIKADITKISYALASVDPQYGEMLGLEAAKEVPEDEPEKKGKKK